MIRKILKVLKFNNYSRDSKIREILTLQVKASNEESSNEESSNKESSNKESSNKESSNKESLE